MSERTVRANARALSEATTRRAAEILARNDAMIERVNRSHNEPRLCEKGLEVLAKEMRDSDVDREIIALHAEFKQLNSKATSIRTRLAPLDIAYDAITTRDGAKKAAEWSCQSEHDMLIGEHCDLCERATYLVDSMIKRRPKTLRGIATVAAAFKADQAHFWEKPEPDRDWKFLSSLGS
jgi:hypothetical protein